MKPKPDKQKELTAASLKRIAKALRVMERNHRKAMKLLIAHDQDWPARIEGAIAQVYHGIASEFDHEASTLRSMR